MIDITNGKQGRARSSLFLKAQCRDQTRLILRSKADLRHCRDVYRKKSTFDDKGLDGAVLCDGPKITCRPKSIFKDHKININYVVHLVVKKKIGVSYVVENDGTE
jgi:hypothetical protein